MDKYPGLTIQQLVDDAMDMAVPDDTAFLQHGVVEATCAGEARLKTPEIWVNTPPEWLAAWYFDRDEVTSG